MQGYLAAKDRLFQFEVWRRQATGTVSEILGEKELDRDIGTRLFKFRGNIEDELNHYHDDGYEIITSYVDGINDYIIEVNNDPSKLPIEFTLLGIKPEIWTPDVVISRHQGLLGNITLDTETVSNWAYEVGSLKRPAAEVAAEWIAANEDRVNGWLGM